MSNKLTASVHKILDVQKFDSGFYKQTLVLKTQSDYPQSIPFEFFKDKTALLDNLTEGQIVTVHFNVEGSEWKGKFYPKLVGWKVDAEQDGNAVIAEAAKEKAAMQYDPNEESGLPF